MVVCVVVSSEFPSWQSVLRASIHQISHRNVGVQAIENLMKKKGKFDYILLETTGKLMALRSKTVVAHHRT
jgi:predicted nucleic-acid-binding protein